jgi:hypothetical protein
VLSGSRKLAGNDEFRRSVYLSADESIEVRRQKTFDRLKTHAVNQGKLVLMGLQFTTCHKGVFVMLQLKHT